MHLGQTATFLAAVMNRPEPTLKVVSRLLREGDWVRTGPRGRNAPHLTADELTSFLLAIMASPDSPAIGLERLEHFRNLPLEDDATGKATLGQAITLLLERLAKDSLKQSASKLWRVVLSVDLSIAMIGERFWDESGSEYIEKEHYFSALVNADPSEPVVKAMPFHGGMGIQISVPWFTLIRIAKVVLANEPDPLHALADLVMAED